MIYGYYEGFLNAALGAGIIFLATGYMMSIYKPKWPNIYYGYRTPRSLRNKESFDAGNTYSAALIKKLAGFMIVAGVLIAIFYHVDYLNLFLGIALTVVISSTIYLIAVTEKYLKKNFPK